MRRLLLLLALFFLPGVVSAQTIPAGSGVTTTSDAGGTYYNFSFPGYAKFKVGDGLQSQAYGCNSVIHAGSGDCQGLIGYFDLKNDPNALWDFGARDTGLFEHIWVINNADMTNRNPELKEGPMAVTITESNNVRVALTLTGKTWPYGDGGGNYTQDCCVSMTKTYVFYRHGGAGTGLGASKVFTKTTLNYDGTDGKGPLTTSQNLLVSQINWGRIAGETVPSNACGSGFGLYTLSPWNIIWQVPGTTINKDYMLFSPVAANDSNPSEFLPANACVSPGGSFQGPEGTGGQPSPGTIYHCDGASFNGCVSQSVSSAVVKANFMQIEQDMKFEYPSLNSNTFFWGGLRVKSGLNNAPPSLLTNTPVSWTSMGWIGDNGIISEATATPYVTEYKTPPTMTPTNATGGAFDTQNGYWTLARTSDNVSISANGLLHSPAWLISNWSVTSAGLTVGGVTKTLNTDFVLAKTDSTHLLLQYLADIASSTTVVFSPASTANPTIMPAIPVANQGTTINFTASDPGTWACTGTDSAGSASACHGSINASTGLYTAPASVTAQHTFGGFQLLPNNHIFNTRIDGLSVNANNAAWMTAAQLAGGSPNWQTDFPVNYLSSASATDNMNFIYTPANNDIFNVPSFPTARAEHGWFHAKQGVTTTDHHVLSVNTDTGMFSDFYQYFATCTTTAASVAGNVATLTCSANPTTLGFVVGDANLVTGGFTGGDTYFNGGPFTITQVTATSISFALTHANASASTNGHASMNGSCISPGNCNSVSGIKYQNSSYALPPISTDAAGMEIQPLVLGLQELEHAVASGGAINHAFRNTFGLGAPASANIWPATTFAFDGNTVPFGARLRLKSSFNIAPYSAIAQVLLTALKNYGTFLVDGGNNWPMNAEQTRWPAAYYAALNEISGIGTLAANMEFVDESGLMVSATSGLTTLNREIVTFTRTSDSTTASVDVVLQGVAVNLPQDYLYIQAGSPAQQLTALVNIGTVTWSMSPAITGVTLTSGGLLTVASNVTPVQSSTITATSTTNAAVAASMTMTAFPSGGIYVLPPKAANYTDTQGHLWNKRTGVDLIDSLGCCSSMNTGSFPALTDISLWDSVVGYSGDIFADDTKLNFTLPNGVYHVTYNLGTYAPAGTFPASGLFIKLSLQNNVIAGNVDPAAVIGRFAKYTIKQNVTVSDNHLSFGIWAMNLGGAPISSFSIEQGSLDTGTTLTPGRKVTSGVTIK